MTNREYTIRKDGELYYLTYGDSTPITTKTLNDAYRYLNAIGTLIMSETIGADTYLAFVSMDI